MANLTAAIQRIRRTRQRLDAPEPQNFDRYRPVYEAILEETADLAGDEGFDALTAWMQEQTLAQRQLPRPAQVRTKAREICRGVDVSIPDGSPLRDQDT